ncbi:hypothetical protein [Rickettsia canadensis]|nr:hypothetical protein [Rickettsia canadensis]AFB21131.1 hypothetical protein RCA_02820 [Rickettsia canadensis str. CA410]
MLRDLELNKTTNIDLTKNTKLSFLSVATFKDGDCVVMLDSSELNPETELVYITHSFYKDFLNKLDKEEKLEQEQIKRLL